MPSLLLTMIYLDTHESFETFFNEALIKCKVRFLINETKQLTIHKERLKSAEGKKDKVEERQKEGEK